MFFASIRNSAILFFTAVAVSVALATEMEFYEKSPGTWVKIRDQRKIVVSAKNEDGRTVSRGAGLVRGSVDDVWKFVTDPEKVRETSRFLKTFTWDEKTGAVDMTIEILFVSYRLRGKALRFPDPENPRIEFEVHEGQLVPFTAVLEIRSAAAQAKREGAPAFSADKTFVRMQGLSARDRALSWPMLLGLEAVLHRTAGFLREAVEEENRK